ncbi:MAG: TlpA disulfide reductase family protein [Campylobacterota bacterium]|nr:TlpA disulfide reductase family protein [Campylobacterota bacterium]
MQQISALLLSILLINLTGCEEKKPEKPPIPIEKSTEVFTQKDLKQHADKQRDLQPKKETLLNAPSLHNIIDNVQQSDTFMLLNTKSQSRKVTFSEDQVIFHRNTKPIILIHIFATWCPPCVAQIPYMNSLQKKYGSDLFVIGILTEDYIDIPSLKSFIAKHEINYFISNSPHNNAFSGHLADTLDLPQNFSVPLTVMYLNGTYFTHYEGSIPIEMIEYDIQQAQKQLKSNKA